MLNYVPVKDLFQPELTIKDSSLSMNIPSHRQSSEKHPNAFFQPTAMLLFGLPPFYSICLFHAPSAAGTVGTWDFGVLIYFFANDPQIYL